MSQQSLANAYESPLNVNTAANDRRFATLAEAVEAAIVEHPATDRKRTLLVVDAACDLPTEWLRQHNVCVLPITVQVDDWTLIDSHDEFDTSEFFHKDLAARGVRAATVPLSPIETRAYLQSHLEPHIDYVLQLTITASRSKIYLNSLAAMQALTTSHNRVRRELGNRDPFRTWVVDTETGFTGQGVMVAEAIRQLDAGVPAPHVAAAMERLRRQVHTLVVPKDLFYLYTRAREKGDKSLSWLGYNVAQRLDIRPVIHAHAGHTGPLLKVRGHEEALDRTIRLCIDQVKRGLTVPVVCLSYAGDLDDVRALPAFSDLRVACQWHGVQMILSTMSMTGGLNVGADAFSIAFATQSVIA